MSIEKPISSRRIRAVLGTANKQAIQEIRENLFRGSTAPPIEADPFHWFYIRAEYLVARPVVVVISDGSELSGVVFLLERKIAGIPIGVYESPYLCGFGSYVGSEQDKSRNVVDAISFLLRRKLSFKISISVRADPASVAHLRSGAVTSPDISIDTKEKGSHFPLDEKPESVFLRFSAKFRRNLRYFRRRAEEHRQYRFVEDLSDSQSSEAVKVLNAGSARFMSHSKALYRCQATRSVPGGFSAGLVAADGTWLSYATGWRTGGVTYIDWQINREESNLFSFATVMRGDLIEHEISRGARALYFLGGSNSTWENACEKHSVCHLGAERTGAAVRVGKRLLLALTKLRPINRLRKIANTLGYGLAQ